MEQKPAKTVEYKEYFVAFMDILGYKNLVLEAEQKDNAIEVISKLEEMIETCIREMLDERSSRRDYTIDYFLFSDSLCIFIPVAENLNNNTGDNSNQKLYKTQFENYRRLCDMCRAVSLIQLMSLEFGIIYRGAIAIGNHYHSKNIIFSNALIEAYRSENTVSVFPRVILHESLDNPYLLYAPDVCHGSDLFVASDDDYLFVDYLRMIVDNIALIGKDCHYIKWHKNVIRNGIKQNLDSDHILEKYAWMMNYHHSRLGMLFGKEVCLEQELREIVWKKFGMHLVDFII